MQFSAKITSCIRKFYIIGIKNSSKPEHFDSCRHPLVSANKTHISAKIAYHKNKKTKGLKVLWMELEQYITGKALHLVPVLYIIGVFIKNTPFIPDWLIPWILTIVGVLGGCAYVGFNIDGVTQGVLTAGVAVLGNQLIKQATNRNQ